MELKQYLYYEESEILELYKSVGWSNYYENPELLKEAYKNSLFIVGAYSDDKLIGIIRVVGDGCSIIYVQDIIVAPAYQRKGIGKRLLDTILEKYENVYQKVLLTENSRRLLHFTREQDLKQRINTIVRPLFCFAVSQKLEISH